MLRRYTDFVTLRQNLIKSAAGNEQFAGIPELPEKRTMGEAFCCCCCFSASLLNPIRVLLAGRFSASFVELRRRGLEDMLTYIVKNRDVSSSPHTRQFFFS